ncbi:DUF742 domain-containing protein [Thermobifida halotolerans]|uniref:DUF742 domain-containing protein n=1 Tax=Thermobifida halotolerans TaxID=483545 RepID=A0A399G3V9_9ACTN|nr:DUF742 domain-containing protein [Thermobifida halotolerans]UOE21008.1 DUF742 domain-containing protein [Thermobifida halotolerans]
MTVPLSRIRPLLGLPSRWSQRPLRHTETLRLTEARRAAGHAVTRAHSLCPSPATPAIVARLYQRPAVLAELAAETGLPLGVVATVCRDLVEAGVVTIDPHHDRTGPRKVVVVAATPEEEHAFVTEFTGDTPALLCMDYPAEPGTTATTELSVSRAVRRPDWPAPLCLMGTPRRVGCEALWGETLRDAASLVLLVGPDCEQSVHNALVHAPDHLPRLAVARPPWTSAQARQRLRELELLDRNRTEVRPATDTRLPERIALLSAP